MARHDAMEGSSTVTVYVCRVEEGGFWAEMPEYPGCYTQAETMDECYIEAGYANRHVTERAD